MALFRRVTKRGQKRISRLRSGGVVVSRGRLVKEGASDKKLKDGALPNRKQRAAASGR